MMNEYWYNKLLDLLIIQTNSENEKLMILYLNKELKRLKIPYYIDAAGNVIVTKSGTKDVSKGKVDIYPCVTSHMDTVHDFVDNFKIYKDIDDNNMLFAMNNKERVGIGGDDKCGIFVCLYLLEVIPQIKVVFFSREEIGCKGSTNINKEFFADCRYLIQLDRKGSKDFIQTYYGDKTISHEFASEIGLIKKKYKYKNQVGTVTDVMKLWKRKVGVSCINLSCGFYKPHTNYEYISINDLWHSVKFTEEIIKNMQPKRYVSLPPPSVVVKTVAASNYNKSVYLQCHKCKQWKRDFELYTHWDIKTKQIKKLCYTCKRGQYSKKERETKLPNADEKHKDTMLYVCHECGIKTSEMEAGDSLKYVNGNLYCNKCASIFFVSDKEPEICWVCNKVIPKDHRIIERFGVRVCEDCACSSDTIILDN